MPQPLPGLKTLIALFLAVGLALLFPAVPPTAAQPQTDYDINDNRLIEISSLAQLAAMRWDPNGKGEPPPSRAGEYGAAFPIPRASMGCPSACRGYELTANLDFDTDGDNDVDQDDDYPDWDGGEYFGIFDGNGHTITRLTITPSGNTTDGLFDYLGSGGIIRDVGVINASVKTGGPSTATGILVGANEGTISASYVQGGTLTVVDQSGAGGLVGLNLDGTIRASYSTATVRIEENARVSVGGLVGGNIRGAVIASYSAGAISGTAATGSLIGGFVSQPTRMTQ